MPRQSPDQVNQGSLYPALYRLEDRGLLKTHWGISPDGRRAKFYELTAAGVRHFAAAERTDWRRFMGAMEQVLQSS